MYHNHAFVMTFHNTSVLTDDKFTIKRSESHSSVGSVADLRTGGCWLDRSKYSFRGLMIVTATGFHSSLTAVRSFDNVYVGKQPVAWKEYCAEYWLKEFQESMDKCNGHHDITEILLKTALNTIQSINQLSKGKPLQ